MKDIYTQIEESIEYARPEIAKRLSVMGDPFEEVRRLKDMLQREFTPPDSVDFGNVAQNTIADIIRAIREAGTGAVTVNINTISNSPGATINVKAPAKPKPTKKRRTVKFFFRCVKDDRLNLCDRIVFSLAWKWAHCNRKSPKRVSISTYRKITGFHADSIKESLKRLMKFGLLSELHAPLISKVYDGMYFFQNEITEYKAHRRVVMVGGVHVKESVFRAVWHSSKTKQQTPAWMSTTLGVSFKTAHRSIKGL